MTLRKLTIDKSVKYIAQIEQTKTISRDIKPNARKNRRQNKKFSQNKKKFIKK